MTRPVPPRDEPLAGRVACASCEKPLAEDDNSRCAICRRRICAGCLRPYGHHMLACDECRLEPW